MSKLTGLIDREIGQKNPNNRRPFFCVGTKPFDEAHWRAWAAMTLYPGSKSSGFAKERAAEFLAKLNDAPPREPGQDDEEAAA